MYAYTNIDVGKSQYIHFENDIKGTWCVMIITQHFSAKFTSD